MHISIFQLHKKYLTFIVTYFHFIVIIHKKEQIHPMVSLRMKETITIFNKNNKKSNIN